MREILLSEGMRARFIQELCLNNLGTYCSSAGLIKLKRLRSIKTYVAIHSEAEKREKWCRVSYKVTMIDGGNEFDCECGQCIHGPAVQPCVEGLRLHQRAKVPEEHIVKRWTKDARDILPPHLSQYQKELVRLGNTSVEAYNRLTELFKSNLTVMLPYAEVRDGLGLEDRLADRGAVLNQVQPVVVGADQNTSAREAVAVLADGDSVSRTSNRLEGLLGAGSCEEERIGAANDK
ncbi:hypothetical protein ACQJBY_005119 [Aegilops geniculata]